MRTVLVRILTRNVETQQLRFQIFCPGSSFCRVQVFRGFFFFLSSIISFSVSHVVSHLTRPRPMAVSCSLVFYEIVSTRHDYNTRRGVAAVLNCALSRLSVRRALACEIKKKKRLFSACPDRRHSRVSDCIFFIYLSVFYTRPVGCELCTAKMAR